MKITIEDINNWNLDEIMQFKENMNQYFDTDFQNELKRVEDKIILIMKDN